MIAGSYYLTPTSDNFFQLIPLKRVLYSKESKYQKIEVIETNKGIALILDGLVQIHEDDEYIYHESLIHPTLISVDHPRSALIVGGGDGCAARELLKDVDIREITLVDLDKDVIEVSKKFLKKINEGSLENKKVKIVVGDGRKFLEKTRNKYDIIVIDATDPIPSGPSLLLYSRQFYEVVKSKLEDGGAFVTQATVFGSNQYTRIYSTIKKVFGNAVCSHSFVKSFGDDWGFVMATKNGKNATREKDEVELWIKSKLRKTPKYLNGETYIANFSIPNEIRKKIEKGSKIIEDSEALRAKTSEVSSVWAFEK
ncbi:MAG: fused MFS/spermidine synthase [Thermoproteota archaeon]